MKIIIALVLSHSAFALDPVSPRTMAEINRNQRIQDCYDTFLKKDGVEGMLKIGTELNKKGAVVATHVDSKKSTIDNSDFAGCVMKVMQKMTFPAEAGGRMKTVSFELKFPSKMAK